jgi:transglutaminase/protease-like cytokinesis protein 3
MIRFSLIILLLISFDFNAQINDFKHIDFTKADNLANINKNKSLKNLPLLTHNLTSKLSTDVEKFRAIYTWICKNIKGNYILHEKVRKRRNKLEKDSISFLKWNKIYSQKIFKTLLTKKSTMCTGYAYLLKTMAELANIKCIIIDGYARSESVNVNILEKANHSWNAVKLNSKWYLCDATLSSGYMIGNGIFMLDYNDGYFLTAPILFAKNHFPFSKKWLLIKNLNEDTFLDGPIYYSEAFKYKVLPKSNEKMNFEVKKDSTIPFSFRTLKNNSTNKVSLVYYSNSKEKKIKLFNIEKGPNQISFATKFKYKGTYDVHLKINNDILLTYIIKVKKE